MAAGTRAVRYRATAAPHAAAPGRFVSIMWVLPVMGVETGGVPFRARDTRRGLSYC
jgi:hypothetical protein